MDIMDRDQKLKRHGNHFTVWASMSRILLGTDMHISLHDKTSLNNNIHDSQRLGHHERGAHRIPPGRHDKPQFRSIQLRLYEPTIIDSGNSAKCIHVFPTNDNDDPATFRFMLISE